jgi:hypothetical protein
MALIDEVRAVCERLAPYGWRELLGRHSLDITADNLQVELLRELPHIDRSIPGFEDFSSEGRRSIEPGHPAGSLLYHALASPNVVTGARGEELAAFPTLRDIKVVENFVFGVEPPSLAELAVRFPQTPMAVVVFASEYRPGPETVHRRHADLCFSRAGVARVGTAEPLYEAKARGFLPFVEGEDHAIRVLPAQYAPYVAVQLRGQQPLFGPMNFNLRQQFFAELEPGDENRLFWVPLHKLFAGRECVRGHDLSVTLEAYHANEKIRRVHLQLSRRGYKTGWSKPDIDQPPFVFADDIAEFSQDPGCGEGVLTPVVHKRFVEPAKYQDILLSFRVPSEPGNRWSPSLEIKASENGFRRASEYVHARHEVRDEEQIQDLNDEEAVADRVREGGYRALHYVDYTGDGWIKALCPELAVELPRTIPAYSMVTAPDFYPNCDQRELIEWWIQRVPRALRERVWRERPPFALSDERMAPNLQLKNLPPELGLPDVDFRPKDDTVTAIVSLPTEGRTDQRPFNTSSTARHAHLPDGAAGVFAPGWDTSRDESEGVAHLASYGLGSPFPEDVKLCAALSSFWPAVSPDAGRSFSKPFPTATPLTDQEVGSVGNLPWDGVPGPASEDGTVVEYASFDHVDYVQSALEGRFSLALTGKVDTTEYTARILAMTRAYAALHLNARDRLDWNVLSFRAIAADNEERRSAEGETGTRLESPCYRITLGRRGAERRNLRDHRKIQVEMSETVRLLVSTPPWILIKRGTAAWQAVRID